YVDQKGVKESFSHQANQSRNGLKNPLEYLVHEWLDPEDYVKLSSTSLAVRSHTQYDEHSARWAAPWVRRRQAAGVPEAESHAVLEGLYGRAFADLVIDKARRAAHH